MTHNKAILVLFSGILFLTGCPSSSPNTVEENSSSSLLSQSSSVASLSSETQIGSSASTASSSTNTSSCTFDATAQTLACPEQVYKTVTINTQTWMAQNLNFSPASGNSWCYDNLESNCVIYGRLYDWNSAISACPTGWHLPSKAEWTALESFVDQSNGGVVNDEGNSLKSIDGWVVYTGITNTDAFGFSALPGGLYYDPIFFFKGNTANWWASSIIPVSDEAYYFGLYNMYSYLESRFTRKTAGYSVRCMQD
jgi:uncharacterized protein (TIGR02145 family)